MGKKISFKKDNLGKFQAAVWLRGELPYGPILVRSRPRSGWAQSLQPPLHHKPYVWVINCGHSRVSNGHICWLGPATTKSVQGLGVPGPLALKLPPCCHHACGLAQLCLARLPHAGMLNLTMHMPVTALNARNIHSPSTSMSTSPQYQPLSDCGPPSLGYTQGTGNSQVLHSEYAELLAILEELGKEIKPTYVGSKGIMETLKRGIIHAQSLVREGLAEMERNARS